MSCEWIEIMVIIIIIMNKIVLFIKRLKEIFKKIYWSKVADMKGYIKIWYNESEKNVVTTMKKRKQWYSLF